MEIITNPYSEALRSALKAVGDIHNPDYVLLPIEPNDDVVLKVALGSNLSAETVRDVSRNMILSWLSSIQKE